MKFEEILVEAMVLVPEADIVEFMKRKSGRFRFPIYINEKLYDTGIEVLELSVRANNCLENAGYTTVGKLVEKVNKREDLKKLRNCGEKTVDEIMEQLFCYQYSQLKEDKKKKYIRRIIELNKDKIF